MTGILMPVPTLRAVDANGVPLSGAKLQFYLTGTTTPAPVYTSSALATPLSNPVVSDSAGLFPPMFRDPTVNYRAQLLTSAGSLVQDIDPVAAPLVNAAGSITAGMLATGAAVSNIGYTPLNKAGDTATNLLLASSTAATNSAGYLGLPINPQNGGYTFALSDAGGMVRTTSVVPQPYTIPPLASVAFPLGTVIVIRNAGSAVVTVTRGAAVALTIAGSSTSKDVAVAALGFATLVLEYTNGWVISGTGLS